jgi:hypothetical protein
MIYGAYSIPKVVEESVCRSSKAYQFTNTGIYKIHATALMPNIPFEEANTLTNSIDETIFINDEEKTPLDFETNIDTQNFLTTRYIGRAPLEWYNSGETTEIGRQFVLICKNGNPSENYRVFGTEDAISGYNSSASDNSEYPGGGE